MSTASAKNLAPAARSSFMPDREGIEAWLVDYLSRLLKLEAHEVRPEGTFDSFGLDSAATVGLTGDLSDWLGIEVDPAVAYDHPTISGLSRYLAEQVAKGA